VVKLLTFLTVKNFFEFQWGLGLISRKVAKKLSCKIGTIATLHLGLLGVKYFQTEALAEFLLE